MADVPDQTTATFASFSALSSTRRWYLLLSVGGASSRVIPIAEGSELVFGRQPDCSFVIDHDGVSRRHARVTRIDDQISVEDLGSRNGTLVNGTAISGIRRLAASDVISIGPATAILATSSPAKRDRQVATLGEFEDRLDVEVDRATRYHRPLGLVLLRLDGSTEDALSHIDVLLGQLRRIDLLAEYGADEIAIVLPESTPQGVTVVADRARATGTKLIVAAGTATFPEDGAHAGELLSVASAKLRGKARPKATRTESKAIGGDVIAIDPLMKHVFELASRAAASPITVLVIGETGAGKEVVAEAIHRAGPRSKRPLVRLNCAALSESLVESELFGHEKGAFTGALATKQGFFEVASGGTLFLDEVGELTLATQAKLLRVLEYKRIVRVGGTTEIAVDTRLVCATNRDLDVEVARGRFRQDLFFRISAFVIPVPPLRDRRVEIAPLVTRFVREFAIDDRSVVVAPLALEALKAYDWPGNVRELRNVIERALVLSDGTIEPQHLPDRILERVTPGLTIPRPHDGKQRIVGVERDAIVAALETTKGNQTHAARKLGVSRFALIRLMEKHNLKPRPR